MTIEDIRGIATDLVDELAEADLFSGKCFTLFQDYSYDQPDKPLGWMVRLFDPDEPFVETIDRYFDDEDGFVEEVILIPEITYGIKTWRRQSHVASNGQSFLSSGQQAAPASLLNRFVAEAEGVLASKEAHHG